ncbi:Lipid II isoglutaminyl synthase (glutamine-hydrolyzing) subunit GatD [Austwickia sp. TVS 96-490-7B]|uniref:type 1 glutamine amidotransferase n=1 Tax=Austwickia sp. TVS 96-490-7B TaxID=2830843 RepID=UPI001C57A173|nr:cobalamin biosynthesis protein CobB [Austwickia sp. TVS 96-490-7B]MBW3084737.1 Lipid II isoglutaminyl synthase (glutamine-hydrolyzing) subunit GatD [Austwickia sp. TVS 96-490-7B]
MSADVEILEPVGPSKGRIVLVHIYPREMSIYGDLGNTRVLARRLTWHGYTCELRRHHPGEEFPINAHIILGGGGQDSGQARVEADLDQNADILRSLAGDGCPMLMICGMYQLFGNAFITADGTRLPGLGIFDVTTVGNEARMIGPVVMDTPHGRIVGYENHSGATMLSPGQKPFGRVLHGHGNNLQDGTEGAIVDQVYGTYLHGPILPANPQFADALIAAGVARGLGRVFEPAEVDDSLSDAARERQISRLLSGSDKRHRTSGQARGV